VITRALGTDPDVDVDAFSVTAEVGDIYLICSDGLSDMVDGEEIERILIRHRHELAAATKALVAAANHGGGDDNITAVVFEIADGAPEPDERTREYALADTAPPAFDGEDTLHPEDAVQPPPPLPSPAGAVTISVDTMVVPASEIRAAVAANDVVAGASVGVGRRLLALGVIALLIVIIVCLVWWGLAR
jgi:hypothetical protein